MARTPFVLLAVVAAAAYADEAADDPVASGLMDKLKSFGANTMAKRAAVGGAAGFVGGALFKASQNMVINSCLVGGAATAAACYAGWVTPEDLVEKVNGAVETGTGYLDKLFGGEEAPVEKISQSKAALSNVAKRMPGLVGGAAMGALLGYRIA
jgi:hypothetical protein